MTAQNILSNHPYIQELLTLEAKFTDRIEFHKSVEPLLLKMGADEDFLKLVVRRNFTDSGYLNQEWSMYNIPYLLIYETDDFVLKIHIFPTAKEYKDGVAAHAIHHHNNYILTTNAFFGSGYESFLFDKSVETDPTTLRTKMKITKHFHQKDWNPSRVDAWEPHVVFVPEKLSATMLIWTPERKRSTDKMRNNPMLKSIKNPLRKIIQTLGLSSVFGISKGITYQFYAAADRKGFMAIDELEYFAPTKAEKGETVNTYCMQMLFYFLQNANLVDKAFFRELLDQKGSVPSLYLPWIEKVLNDEKIQEVFHKETINVPQKNYSREDILEAERY